MLFFKMLSLSVFCLIFLFLALVASYVALTVSLSKKTNLQQHKFWSSLVHEHDSVLNEPSKSHMFVCMRIVHISVNNLAMLSCPPETLYGESTDKPLLDCCACGTAKYRVTFYGNWSEKLHPKDYPSKTVHDQIEYVKMLTPVTVKCAQTAKSHL